MSCYNPSPTALEREQGADGMGILQETLEDLKRHYTIERARAVKQVRIELGASSLEQVAASEIPPYLSTRQLARIIQDARAAGWKGD